MKCLLGILISLLLINNIIKAQNERIETDSYLYWQNNSKINHSDFKKQIDSIGISMCEKYKTKSLANVQIHSIVDYPKKARKIKTLKEKIYFAPAFCKKCSMILEKDSNELKISQMFFDIAEYCSRRARLDIKKLDSLNHGNGFAAAAFPQIVDRMYKMMGEMFGGFGQQVIVLKKPGAYELWRSDCDKLLNETKDYATSKEECIRFIEKKPYSEEYKEVYSMEGIKNKRCITHSKLQLS